MAKVQITTYYGNWYCEICLCLAVVKVNPSVTRMLTSIYIYNAFIKFGLGSKKQLKSEGLEDSPGLNGAAAGLQEQAGLMAAGAQHCPEVLLFPGQSDAAGCFMDFIGHAPRAGFWFHTSWCHSLDLAFILFLKAIIAFRIQVFSEPSPGSAFLKFPIPLKLQPLGSHFLPLSPLSLFSLLSLFLSLFLLIFPIVMLEIFQGNASSDARGCCKELDGYSIKDSYIRKNAKPSVSNPVTKESSYAVRVPSPEAAFGTTRAGRLAASALSPCRLTIS